MAVATGTRLGRYQIVAAVGVGGMGEVWRARDARLGRDVAIKVLPAEFAADPERLRRFEQEARALAALSHPNILAIHDFGRATVSLRGPEGAEAIPSESIEITYAVTELLEGETLKEQIGRGGLTVSRSIDLGIQIARGLAAAHEKGIVHRDLKPGNVFVTGDGTVKILDFGLARLLEAEGPVEVLRDASTRDPQTATGARLGTVGYMSPEQVRGLTVDHRADIFAFGCVLYEMLSGRRAFKGDTEADTISAILTKDPAPLSSSMQALPSGLERIVRRCLEKRPDDRFTSARDLGFALQAVAESVPREVARKAEEIRPYPGLSAYTEADAERFFGRDEEIAALWRKIPDRSLLGLIGPSGAGKTSFLRAGIVPKAPPGWRCLVATPGQAPFAALARAFVPQFAGDTDATSQLFQIHEPAIAVRIVERWRERCDHALLIVDQFEELFTLNGEEVQARFADLLGRIASLDSVHVLLSMRDDFLFGCHGYKSLAPIFDSITPLGPPTGNDLRKAVTEPAKRFGFAFEDDALVEEMVQGVEGERGALPLLAFAIARLWEERDGERKLLTREAYERLGGVAGALAQHAEATLERIGAEREPVVREIFRNLSTAQQTRCVVDAEELLSVFPEDRHSDARDVLNQLIDARLLTSFEVEAPDGSHHHRIEVVHESLLQRWPRLVRWQTQDADAAQLRDQLRQAAHLWEEKGRPQDLLWAGTSFREYQVWRERYLGGLSHLEEAFGEAMTALAGRRRRRRRIAVAALIVLLAAGLTVVGAFWRRSVQETRRAEVEARQHEAAKLLSLGRLRLADHPNAALAYAIASLERADNDPARRFAVEALWQGPSAFFLPTPSYETFAHVWSPDGRWLAAGGLGGVFVFERETGKHDRFDLLEEPMGFTSDGRRLVNADERAEPRVVLHVRTVQGGALERSVERPENAWFALNGDQVVTIESDGGAPLGAGAALVRRFSLNESAAELLGRWEPEDLSGQRCVDIDPSGKWLFSLQSGRLIEQRLDALSSPGRVLGAHEGAGVSLRARPWQERVVTSDASGEIRIWNVTTARLERTLMSPADARSLALDPRGRFVATGAPLAAMTLRSQVLFDLRAPRTAEPVPLVASELRWLNRMSFSPDGNWLAGVFAGPVVLWNMAGTRSSVIGRQKPPVVLVAFTPDGRLVSTSEEGAVRLWPLDPNATRGMQVLWAGAGALLGGTLEIDPGGRFVVVADRLVGKVLIVPLDGSPVSTYELKGPPGAPIWTGNPRLDPSGKLLLVPAASPARTELRLRRIIDLTTREERSVDTYPEGDDGCGGQRQTHLWLSDGRLVTDGDGGLRLWDLETGKSLQLRPCQRQWATDILLLASHDARTIVRLDTAERTGQIATLSTFDIRSATTRVITSHGNTMYSFALDGSGTTLVTGALDGAVRVGLLNGEEPHLLYGHTATVSSVAVSPDGRWIASGSDDGTIRLWAMPDFSKPPLHTWPREELLAKLKSLTNLRAVRDPASDTGWKIEVGPFPGWKDVPEWQP